MRMKIILFILFITGILISGCSSNNTFNNDSVKSFGQNPIKIEFNFAFQPKIYENYLVFDTSNNYGEPNTWGNGESNIYLYDINYNKIIKITNDNSNQYTPVINKDYIFWIDDRFGEDSIFRYDLNKKVESKVPIEFPYSSNLEIKGLSLEGDSLFFSNGHNYLFFYNITSDKLDYRTIPTNNYVSFKRSYNYVTWVAEGKVYVYDYLSNKTITPIKNPSYKLESCIYKNTLVWSDTRNGKNNYDLYMMNLSDGKEIQITNRQDSSEFECDIYKNKIVYIVTDNNPFSEIHMYDIITGSNQILIGKEKSRKEFPQIFENYVTWEDQDKNYFFIQLYKLAD